VCVACVCVCERVFVCVRVHDHACVCVCLVCVRARAFDRVCQFVLYTLLFCVCLCVFLFCCVFRIPGVKGTFRTLRREAGGSPGVKEACRERSG